MSGATADARGDPPRDRLKSRLTLGKFPQPSERVSGGGEAEPEPEPVAFFLDQSASRLPDGGSMIIDRETFTDIAKHLEAASEGLLSAATGVASLCPEIDPGEPASFKWLSLIESLVAVNGEITALETVLRAVLEANREEIAAARASGASS